MRMSMGINVLILSGFFILIVLLPALAIAFFLIYKFYLDLKKKEFEIQGGIVLTCDRLRDILERLSPSMCLMIFRSAICDHEEIEGKRYYTQFPFGAIMVIGHDNHRRSFIAYKVGQIITKSMIPRRDLDLCAEILLELSDYQTEPYYTQLFVWDSLGALLQFQKMRLIQEIGPEYLQECLKVNFLTGLGVLRFIFKIDFRQESDPKVKKLIEEILIFTLEEGSLPLIALTIYKIGHSPYFDLEEKRALAEFFPDHSEINRFLMNMEHLSLGYTQEELKEGLISLGFQPPPYSLNSTEGEIIGFLLSDFLDELYVPSSFVLRTFDSERPRQDNFDFLWY